MNNPDSIQIVGLTADGNLKTVQVTPDGVMQVNSPPGAPGGATETTLAEINNKLPPALGPQAEADSISVIFPPTFSFPITTAPTVVAPVDIPTLNLAIAGTVYTVNLTDVTCLEFFARNNNEDLRWHFLPGKVETNNYFTFPVGGSKVFPFTSEKWTGVLYFLSPSENNIEVEIIAYAAV